MKFNKKIISIYKYTLAIIFYLNKKKMKRKMGDFKKTVRIALF